ncbi:MAG TPA: hypothetical protein VGM10_14670 [Actinocrinis sp.]|jgi:hypothetical protein
MGELILREWRRDELRRIYVNDADTREPIGFLDRTSGEIVVRYKARVREVLAALRPFLLAGAPIAAQRRVDVRRTGRVRVEPPRQAEPVLPEPAAEPERLLEVAPEPVLETVSEPVLETAPELVEVVAQPEPEPVPPRVPEMDVDLSTAIDGATVQDRAVSQAAAAPRAIQDLAAGLASTFTARMHRTPAPNPQPSRNQNPSPSPSPSRPPIPAPHRPAGDTRIVGKRLDKLRRDGWRILDSARLGKRIEVEFVAIGRPGVFAVRARNHARAQISVEGTAVKVDRTAYPYIDECCGEADSVARRLAAAGMYVRVTPVLALVGVSGLDLSRASADCIVCRAEMLDHVLRDQPGILTNRDQTQVYDLACQPDTWLD